jgi:hypothetical protein
VTTGRTVAGVAVIVVSLSAGWGAVCGIIRGTIRSTLGTWNPPSRLEVNLTAALILAVVALAALGVYTGNRVLS